jgi:hypothetical protein
MSAMKKLVFLAVCVGLFLFVAILFLFLAIWYRRTLEPPHFNSFSVDTRLEPISDSAMLDEIARLKAERIKLDRENKGVRTQ